MAQTSLVVLGGSLKIRESLSARLGDMLSMLYMASLCLKRFQSDGSPAEDRVLLEAALEHLLHQYWLAVDGLLKNFPNRLIAFGLRVWIAPWGTPKHGPTDQQIRQLALMMGNANSTRDRLCLPLFFGQEPKDYVATIEATLAAKQSCLAIEKIIRKAMKSGQLTQLDKKACLDEALAKNLISANDHQQYSKFLELQALIISVDDFDFAIKEASKPPKVRRRVKKEDEPQ
jgi:acyl-CoA dehydrogenase